MRGEGLSHLGAIHFHLQSTACPDDLLLPLALAQVLDCYSSNYIILQRLLFFEPTQYKSHLSKLHELTHTRCLARTLAPTPEAPPIPLTPRTPSPAVEPTARYRSAVLASPPMNPQLTRKYRETAMILVRNPEALHITTPTPVHT